MIFLDTRKNTEEICGPIPDAVFNALYQLANKITDYGITDADLDGRGDADDTFGDAAAADATGVAVVFDDKDSDEDSDGEGGGGKLAGYISEEDDDDGYERTQYKC